MKTLTRPEAAARTERPQLPIRTHPDGLPLLRLDEIVVGEVSREHLIRYLGAERAAELLPHVLAGAELGGGSLLLLVDEPTRHTLLLPPNPTDASRRAFPVLVEAVRVRAEEDRKAA